VGEKELFGKLYHQDISDIDLEEIVSELAKVAVTEIERKVTRDNN
jgi:hypothetical protein